MEAERVIRRLRPYAYHLAFAIYMPALLMADALVANERQQFVLGVVSAAMLALATRYARPGERRLVWLAVAVWAVVELFASRVWGIYVYRFDNVPLFVPFGHGMIYLFGLTAARTPFMATHGRAVRHVALALATTWATLGLSLLPLITGRWDVAGAALLPAFAYGLRRSRSANFYAAVFFATAALEILGTALGTWNWVATQPLTQLPSGNPPSVVATAYCLFDFLLLRAAGRLGIFPTSVRDWG